MSPEVDASDERPGLADLIVYAPLGLLIKAAEEVPQLTQRGRDAVRSQLTAARAIGRIAVTQGRVEAGRMAEQWNELGRLVRSAERPAPSHDAKRPEPPRRAARRHPPAPSGLGIAGYESLSASQVVTRLDGLTPEQLEAVKAYESSTRGRRTILGRISQLQTSG